MKRFLTALLSVVLVLSCMTAMMSVSAEEAEIPGAIADATTIPSFVEAYNAKLTTSGCDKTFNEDGSMTLTGNWTAESDSAVGELTIQYKNLMEDHFTGYDSYKKLPNNGGANQVVAFRVAAPAISLSYISELEIEVGRGPDAMTCYGEMVNEIKCDGNEEWWIYDFTKDGSFDQYMMKIKLIWCDDLADETNVGAAFTVYEMKMFKNAEEALAATGATKLPEKTAKPTEAPTEPVTEPATEAPTQAPVETEAPKGGCGAVVGSSAAMVLSAVAAFVALKKKN